MRQVMFSRCVICNETLGCYDSTRKEKKIRCDDCKEPHCPDPTDGDSHGYCKFHFERELAKQREAMK